MRAEAFSILSCWGEAKHLWLFWSGCSRTNLRFFASLRMTTLLVTHSYRELFGAVILTLSCSSCARNSRTNSTAPGVSP